MSRMKSKRRIATFVLGAGILAMVIAFVYFHIHSQRYQKRREARMVKCVQTAKILEILEVDRHGIVSRLNLSSLERKEWKKRFENLSLLDKDQAAEAIRSMRETVGVALLESDGCQQLQVHMRVGHDMRQSEITPRDFSGIFVAYDEEGSSVFVGPPTK